MGFCGLKRRVAPGADAAQYHCEEKESAGDGDEATGAHDSETEVFTD
jgi:hypothetical protein